MKTVHMVSLGCARNRVDSEQMLGLLSGAGWRITEDPAEAEVIVVNTCSFITPAAEESIDTILELAEYKEKGRCRRLIVAGCLPERYRQDLAETLPEVDAFLGTGAFHRIVEAAGVAAPGGCLLPDPESAPMEAPGAFRVRSTAHVAYLKIAEGCSRRCTYCIIPTLRGRQRSRPVAEIEAEARRLIASGARELVLIAQDTTRYGVDLAPPEDFSTLLEHLADLSGRQPGPYRPWLRFLYGHPESLTDPVIRIVAAREEICSYFDIPVQHASPSVLKAMGRGYGPEAIRRMAERIRSDCPGAAIRTTVIVGFPGETEKDFIRLSDLVSEIRFDHLGVFLYSDAADLPSHRLPEHVPAALAQERYHRIMSQQALISSEKNRRHIGRSHSVLIEEAVDAALFSGRTRFQAPEVDGVTYVRGEGLVPGDFVRVRITSAEEYDLMGEPE
ncbi:MAG: 30S ribosomal protein S12 methylthiotransferase RimO [Desulfobacterales bacterium]